MRFLFLFIIATAFTERKSCSPAHCEGYGLLPALYGCETFRMRKNTKSWVLTEWSLRGKTAWGSDVMLLCNRSGLILFLQLKVEESSRVYWYNLQNNGDNLQWTCLHVWGDSTWLPAAFFLLIWLILCWALRNKAHQQTLYFALKLQTDLMGLPEWLQMFVTHLANPMKSSWLVFM